MEKFKVTKKEMKSKYHRIIKIGYCDAQFLLAYESPCAFSTRAEGWACDYYDIDGILISTGYAPLEDKNMKHDYNLIREYDQKAREIIYGQCEYEYGYQKEKVRLLLKEFLSKVIVKEVI